MPIGSFQFDNLIRNRVGFFLLSFGPEMDELRYSTVEKLHLQKVFRLWDPELKTSDTLALIESQDWGKEVPLILLCRDGQYSKKVVEGLEARGYLNSYYVLDGLVGFLAGR